MANSNFGLQHVLADPDFVLLFREFLKGSFASENLAFIVEVENFKDLKKQGTNQTDITRRAKEIFNKYFNSSSQVSNCFSDPSEIGLI